MTASSLKETAKAVHNGIPGLRKLPPVAVAIVLTLILVNAAAWACVGVVLVSNMIIRSKENMFTRRK